MLTIHQLKILENIVIVIVTGLVVVALYWLSKSFHCLWALIFLVFMNDFWSCR